MSDVRRREEADRQAAALGFVIHTPRSNELFVDIDCEEDLVAFEKSRTILREIVLAVRVTPSPSGKPGHYHVRVLLTETVASEFDRIMLQAILGSDRQREALSWRNARANDPDPTLFFERPDFVV